MIKAFLQKYTNLFGSLASLAGLAYGGLEKIGQCSVDAVAFTAACTASWIPVWLLPWMTISFAILAIIGKLTRAGGPLSSMFGPTAVIVPPEKSGVGTVTPKQVEAPKTSK